MEFLRDPHMLHLREYITDQLGTRRGSCIVYLKNLGWDFVHQVTTITAVTCTMPYKEVCLKYCIAFVNLTWQYTGSGNTSPVDFGGAYFFLWDGGGAIWAWAVHKWLNMYGLSVCNCKLHKQNSLIYSLYLFNVTLLVTCSGTWWTFPPTWPWLQPLSYILWTLASII